MKTRMAYPITLFLDFILPSGICWMRELNIYPSIPEGRRQSSVAVSERRMTTANNDTPTITSLHRSAVHPSLVYSCSLSHLPTGLTFSLAVHFINNIMCNILSLFIYAFIQLIYRRASCFPSLYLSDLLIVWCAVNGISYHYLSTHLCIFIYLFIHLFSFFPAQNQSARYTASKCQHAWHGCYSRRDTPWGCIPLSAGNVRASYASLAPSCLVTQWNGEKCGKKGIMGLESSELWGASKTCARCPS